MVQYIYTLGTAGERLSVAELDRIVEYTYDNLYRLTGETITEGEKITAYTYAYDSVGNRILKTVNGKETEYSYNALNQLLSDSETTYEYDLNGNLVRVIGTDNSALYEYNSANKLVKATVQKGNNVVVEEYTYDYAGNRTIKTTRTSNGEVEYVKYLNDNSSLTNVLAEVDSEGNVLTYYTIGADLISQETDGEVFTYLYDGHGTVRALANEKGKVTDTYTYDAFGNLLKSTGKTANNYLYCGEQYDNTTGLYYLRARYMDTTTGRFISQDSYAGTLSDPTSLHKYLYANSNPVMYTDPSGYMAEALVATSLSIEAIATYTIAASAALAIGIKIINSLCDLMFNITLQNAIIELQFTFATATDINYAFVVMDEIVAKTLSTLQEIVNKKIGIKPLYTVYTLLDSNDTVRYVGRTKNYETRMQQHFAEGSKNSDLKRGGKVEHLTYAQARGLEQVLMVYYHTRNWIKESGNNSINGVSPKNENKDDYSDAMKKIKQIYESEYVQNQLDNEMLNLLEDMGAWW